ncbi:MAG: DNA gyrase subunit A [Ruminococcaceae bacterium]|nr:DNA gyrase subunit A [Oscillospiraceae bacterium]
MDERFEGQNITSVEISAEVKKSFIDYAMSVIVDRALPDVRDGLKPVHRRILYAMYDDGLTHSKPFRKSATTVGNVLGHYHPHGDAAVYNAMVRLAQPFSLRYPLVEGQGNFGNIDGDGAAAYRYTEARLARMADEMLADIDKDVVDFIPNFDNKALEPTVLPSRFPNLLVNGSVGIAVGMATNIPPHNLNEVIDGAIHLMYNPEATVVDLMQFIKGPDFPTYATIHGTSGIYQAYMTGKGRVVVRAKADFEEERNGKTSIIITEIPYQVNKSMLVASIADLVKDKRVDGITAIRDESGRAGMRIVIELRRDVNPQIMLNQLYSLTQLQDTFAINMLALVGGEPRVLNLKQMLRHYIDHQREVVERRIRFNLDKARKRAHILEGLKIAIDNIDEVIKIIRFTPGGIPEVKEKLIERFDLTEIQATEIVQMPLGRLSGLEIDKILAELDAIHAKIKELTEILESETGVIDIVRDEMLEIKKKFGDERRTAIEEVENEILIEDLIERKDCVVTISHAGYIKRLPVDEYNAQRRGGRGITTMKTKEEDFVQSVIIANTHNYLMLFTNKGRVFMKKCYEIPEASKNAKGTNLVNIIELQNGEAVTAYLSIEDFKASPYLTMITKNGIIKRTLLESYKNIRRSGLIAINLDEGDELLHVLRTDGNSDVLLATHKGFAVHFDETSARTLGRTARGVKAINLSEGDLVVGAVALNKDDERHILFISESGYGKRSRISDFPIHNRGGKGVTCHKTSDKLGMLAGIQAVSEDDDVMLITNTGMIIRTRVNEISVYSRTAAGVRVMRIGDDMKIVSFTRVDKQEEAPEAEENVQAEGTEGSEAVETVAENTESTEVQE